MRPIRAWLLATTLLLGCAPTPLPPPAVVPAAAPTIETRPDPPSRVEAPEPEPEASPCEQAIALAAADIPKRPPSPFPIIFDDNDRQQLPAFVDSFDDDRFREAHDESKSRLLFLVAMESTRSNELVAALNGLTRHFHYRVDAPVLGALGLELPEARNAFDRAVLQHVESKMPKVRRYALEAAMVGADRARPEPELVAAIVRAACVEGDAGRRIGGLRALGELRSFRATVEDVVLAEALRAPEPEVVATALEVLYAESSQVQDRMLFPERLRGLLSHAHPAIRGLAARGLYDIADGDAEKRETIAAVLPLFDDPHPYVRVMATDALVRMDVNRLVHRIVTRVDRDDPCTLDLHYRQSDGASAKIALDPCSHDFEGVAYLDAIDWISLGEKYHFDVKIDRNQAVVDIARLRTEVRVWYDQNKDRFPPPHPPKAGDARSETGF